MSDYKNENNSNEKKTKTIWNPFKKGYWNKDNLLGRNKPSKPPKSEKMSTNQDASKKKMIKETRCTCEACGNVWYYGKEEAWANAGEKLENFGNSMSNAGKDMMCCGGCVPALFIPEKQEKKSKDLNQCQNCGSKAVKKEEVTHVIE